ncbi:prolipoprotein diacylglyceryl transferase [Candidatus Uhrbacteria bacterium]|nr:prolipoprotein diacylglyceryl transferase [Candidatus Uhrbacteria bacterium]
MPQIYGVVVALAGVAAFGVAYFLFLRVSLRDRSGVDFYTLFFFVLLGGIVGGRALFILYHLSYFIEYPFEIPAIWHGGWVWHGAAAGGGIALYTYARFKHVSFLRLADVIVPGLAIGQAIGRWGNYFNQEAYGLPTSLPWGIRIDFENRIAGYETFTAFHPTFLYESLWDVALFVFLFIFAFRYSREGALARNPGTLFALYLILYSAGRFMIEFLRIDTVPVIVGLRAPQWISLILIAAGLFLLQKQRKMI